MVVCAAFGCSNKRDKKIPGVTYHRFPADGLRRRQWTLATKRANWQPTKHSILCSRHFESHMFKETSAKQKLRLLKDTAVPTIFGKEEISAKQKIRHPENSQWPLPIKQEPLEEILNDSAIAALLNENNGENNQILVYPDTININGVMYGKINNNGVAMSNSSSTPTINGTNYNNSNVAVVSDLGRTQNITGNNHDVTSVDRNNVDVVPDFADSNSADVVPDFADSNSADVVPDFDDNQNVNGIDYNRYGNWNNVDTLSDLSDTENDNVVVISDLFDTKNVLGSEDVDKNRVIVVSDWTIKNEIVDADDMQTLKNDPLLLNSDEFILRRVGELKKAVENFQSKLKTLRQTSRRQNARMESSRKKLYKLTKKIRVMMNVTTSPAVHVLHKKL